MEKDGDDEKSGLIQVEQALLGILLFDSTAIDLIDVALHQAHFTEPFHGRLWDLMCRQVADDRSIDTITMLALCDSDTAFHDLGGKSYFADLVDRAPPSSHVNDYAAMIVHAWQKREIASLFTQVSYIGDAGEMMDEIRAQLDRVASFDTAKDDFESSEAVVKATLDGMAKAAAEEKPMGLPTGIASMDRRIGGLVPGDLIVLAGPSSMGKTLTGRSTLYRAASLARDAEFAYYSLEMTKFQIGCRTLSEIAFNNGVKIPYNQYRSPTDKMVQNLEAFRYQVPANVYVSDKSRRTVDDIERSIRRRARGGKLKAVVIDHLQRIQIIGRQFDPLGDVCVRLKNLAMELGITIILLCQMNREIFRRDNKRPMLSDLRQSGAIEQEADVVIFPWREYQILKDEKPKKEMDIADWEYKMEKAKNSLEMIYGKVRMGEVGSDDLWMSPAHDTFSDKAPGDPMFDFGSL